MGYSGWALVLLERLQLLSFAAMTSSMVLGLWAVLMVTQAAREEKSSGLAECRGW